MSNSPYAAAPPEKLAEIVRLAEARLEAQLTLGVSADQRAMTMASILAAIDAAIIGLWAATQGDEATASVALIILAFGFAAAAGLAAWSAVPIAWEIPGNEPSQWLDDIAEGDSLHNGAAAMAEFYDEMIHANNRQLSTNANFFVAAFVVAFLTLIVSGVATILGF